MLNISETGTDQRTRFLHRIKLIFLILISLFFLVFGIQLLIAAYHLNNPFWFVMTFFASNLIILISGALLVGFILRMRTSKVKHCIIEK